MKELQDGMRRNGFVPRYIRTMQDMHQVGTTRIKISWGGGESVAIGTPHSVHTSSSCYWMAQANVEPHLEGLRQVIENNELKISWVV